MNETDLKAWVNLGHNETETRSIKIMFHCTKNAFGGIGKLNITVQLLSLSSLCFL